MSKVKPTIDDVARVTGVSRATASRVINNAPGASDALRDRVHAAVTELGHEPGAVLADITPGLAACFYGRCRRVVSLVPMPEASSVPTMRADNVGGAFEAVRVLHRRGRRRIAAIHGPELNPCAIDRRTGYRRALRNLGLTGIEANGDFHRQGGHDAAKQLLAQHPDIDAMFIACDLMAAAPCRPSPLPAGACPKTSALSASTTASPRCAPTQR